MNNDDDQYVRYRELVQAERGLNERMATVEQDIAVLKIIIADLREVPRMMREVHNELGALKRSMEVSGGNASVTTGVGVALHDMASAMREAAAVRDVVSKPTSGKYGWAKDVLAYIGFAAAAIVALKIFGPGWMPG